LLAHHDTLRANGRSGAMRQAGSRHHERWRPCADLLASGASPSSLLRPESGYLGSPQIEAGLVEYPAPGLYLHLDLSVREADGQVAYRTTPAPSSPEPSPRDGLRQNPAL